MDPTSTPKDDDYECEDCTFSHQHRRMKNPSYSSSTTSRRTPSFSSFSSHSSSSLDSSSFYIPDHRDSPLNPATPLRFSGVPFSWEHFPGIPKNQHSKKIKSKHEDRSSLLLLPLPPTTRTTPKKTIKKSSTTTVNSKQPLKWDPFIAALVECSKDDVDDHHHGLDLDHDHEHDHPPKFWSIATAKVSKSLSDRFGLINLYNTSCKSTCAVAESIRHLPRSTRGSSYDQLINSRPRN